MKKVLIAEDHQGIAESYKLILESENYEVILTENGEDCIRTFDKELLQRNLENYGQPKIGAFSGNGPFDLVVLDYHMPPKDGIDVARHILSEAPYQRILIASSYPRDVISKSAQNLGGCVELLLKPFDLLEFADVIEKRSALHIIGVPQKQYTKESQSAILKTQIQG